MLTEDISIAMDSRLRRSARKHGYSLCRSRKAMGAHNLGGYMIVDASNGWVVDGAFFDLGADYVEAWLKDLDAPERTPC